MKKIIFLIASLIFLNTCEKSVSPPNIVSTDFNKKILDGYFVMSMAFDNQGNAWIGTFKQGLIKYNSEEIIVYNSSNSIIPDDAVIYDIEIDSENNVWIGCNGLIKYDGTGFTLYNSSNTPIPEDFVSSIEVDSEDNIWFTSCRFRQGGVVKKHGANWEVFTPDNSDLPANLVQDIAIDKNDNVWLALSEVVDNAYLAKISGNDNWTIYTDNDLGFSPYYFGNIQMNSKNELCGAIDYSLSSAIIQGRPQVFIFDGDSSSLLSFDSNWSIGVKSISVDNQDNIWCAIYGGYAVYNGKDWFVDGERFKETSVFAIEQAKDGKIWIGTGDGVYIN